MHLEQSLTDEKNKIYELIKRDYTDNIETAITTIDKAEREENLDHLKEEIILNLKNNYLEQDKEPDTVVINEMYDYACKEIMRKIIIEKRMRVDSRKPEDIRTIDSEISILPRVHGSALFTRGQTQALVITTLGSVRDEQSVDTLEEDTTRKFYLHYNFPPFLAGDIKPEDHNREEIGHVL